MDPHESKPGDIETSSVRSSNSEILMPRGSLYAGLAVDTSSRRSMKSFQVKQIKIIDELNENQAPQTVGDFVSRVEQGFYDGLVFHRVLPGFVAQDECPKGNVPPAALQVIIELRRPSHS